ncbi:MAG: hypothetical protein OXF02_04285 [Simkaniaceae bacterium]|nr:hypothetical protein [Simkaniaceae bacterium]
MVGPIPSATVVVGQQLRNVAPVVNQPRANNAAQEWCGPEKKTAIAVGAAVGELVVGVGCSTGAVAGAVLKLGQLGASEAVMAGTATGIGCAGILCIVGSMLGTLACHAKSLSE